MVGKRVILCFLLFFWYIVIYKEFKKSLKKRNVVNDFKSCIML